MSSFKIGGTLKVIGDIQTFPSGFTKREIVIETHDDKYPQLVSLSLLKDQTSLTNGMQTEDLVTAYFNIRGREYDGRYFNDLVAWKLTKDYDQSQADQHLNQILRESPSSTDTQTAKKEELDEIPF